jgi:hypothetical protein
MREKTGFTWSLDSKNARLAAGVIPFRLQPNSIKAQDCAQFSLAWWWTCIIILRSQGKLVQHLITWWVVSWSAISDRRKDIYRLRAKRLLRLRKQNTDCVPEENLDPIIYSSYCKARPRWVSVFLSRSTMLCAVRYKKCIVHELSMCVLSIQLMSLSWFKQAFHVNTSSC